MTRTPFGTLGTDICRLISRAAWAAVMVVVGAGALLPVISPQPVLAVGTFEAVGQIGQPDFLSGQYNRTSTPRDNGVSGAGDAVVDPVRHRLFVSDPGNGRVLVFALDEQNHLVSRTAVTVLGKPGLGAAPVSEAPNSVNMASPQSLAYDTVRDRLFVADEHPGYNRVMVFDTSVISQGMPAAYVLGAADFSADKSGGVAPTEAITAGTQGLAYDPAASLLYVADAGANRVLAFDAADLTSGEAAVKVLGQPDFTSSQPGGAASNLHGPRGVAVDSAGSRLFVSDTGNNRVVSYETSTIVNGEAAVSVIGQPGFDSQAEGLGESSMRQPADAVYDGTTSRLFVADNGNNRVLVFDAQAMANGQAAQFVIGQPGFSDSTSGTSQNSIRLGQSGRIGLDPGAGRLYLGDSHNNRFLVFDTAGLANGMPATDVIGQAGSDGAPRFLTGYADNRHPLPNSLAGASHAALDLVRHRLFVADRGNARVNVYLLDDKNRIVSDTPDYVLGQEYRAYSLSHTSQRGLADASAVAYDATRDCLFVADSINNRVVGYDLAGLTDFMEASFVIGQDDYTSNIQGVAANRLSSPAGLALDEAGRRLFVADSGNQRVLSFDLNALTNGMSASNVLGAGGFDAAYGCLGANAFSNPSHLAYDEKRGRLFVADSGNNRVLVFEASGISDNMDAKFVIGQKDFAAATAGTVAADTLSGPRGLAYDGANDRLFVADSGRSRVLMYDADRLSDGMPASAVIGQPGFDGDGPGTGSASLQFPEGLVFDPLNHRLFTMDSGNSRIVWFDFMSMDDPDMPRAAAGKPVRIVLNASNPRGSLSFSLDGGDLPPGLALSSDGVISGTPLTGGSYEFTVKASDVNGGAGDFFARRNLKLHVARLARGILGYFDRLPLSDDANGGIRLKGKAAVLFMSDNDNERSEPMIMIPEEAAETATPATETRLYWRLLWWLPILVPLLLAIVLYRRCRHHTPPLQ